MLRSRDVRCGHDPSAALVPGRGAWSQTTRTIKIVVPLPPGGAGDILARLLAEQVEHMRKAGLVIENRPGAGSVIGTEAVARAAPDGNTLLINAPYLLIAPQVQKVSYDPLTSFEPVCYLVSSPGIIVVNSASPYRTLAGSARCGTRQARRIDLASVGPATVRSISGSKGSSARPMST